MRKGISAIMVVHNEEKVIRRCLESIKAASDEILIIHDGPCDDKTIEICKEYTKNIFIRPRKKMAAMQLKYLFKKVKYDWIEQSLEPKIHAIPSATESGVIQDYQKTRAFFPQILIPLKEKDEFVMPKEHEDEMVRMLKKASEILVIGWKGSEAHFLNCLKENIGEKEIYLTNITGESNSTIKELKAILPNLEATMFLEDYFESHYEGSKNVIDMQHEKGTFSSYIMNVSKVKTKGFFDEK